MALSMQEHIGRVLAGRYRIVAPIGSGASAQVFLADDVTLRRRVAIKVLHSALASDAAFLRRFQAEAQGVAALNHPNIMRVYDWGETDEGPFVVLEYLGGGSLRDVLDQDTQLSVSQAVLVGLEAARGLDYAHRRGLVHRDIKPANLLFDDEARLCIADFGIARALAEAAWTEPSGAILGTARYASPEQVQGTTVDGKTDVYALGLVLIEAVTGTVPFSADTTIATLMARVNAEVDVPSEMGALAPIIAAATKTDPTERIDAAEFAEQLNDVARELPTPEKIGLVGTRVGEVSVVADRDQTMMGRPRVADFGASYVAGGEAADVPDMLLPPETFVDRARMRRADRSRLQLERRKHWKPTLIVASVISAVVFGVLAIAPMFRPSHPVPTLVGKPLTEARQAVEPFNFNLIIRGERYDDQPLGYVLSQNPSKGKLHEGDQIGVILSKGPAPRTVPDLSAKSESDAKAALEKAGFKMVRQGKRDQSVPKGIVMDWTPRGDQPKGSEITVIVSDGPPLKPVPDVTGKTKDNAAAILSAAGFQVAYTEAFSDTVDTGVVISTSPGAGVGAEQASTVTVRVSKGPQLVTVPNVTGYTATVAASKLEALGFQIAAVYGPPGKKVFASDPAAGTKAKRGSSISLYTR